MSPAKKSKTSASSAMRMVRTYKRFSTSQRWEHALLVISITLLLLTGLPQKFRTTDWSHAILTSPERLELIQTVHHISAILLALVAFYHLGKIIYQLSRRSLPGNMLPTWKDVQDAWHTLLYLLFIKKEIPRFGKYNFEQKVTYWFLFFAIGILGISGLINWFPEVITRVLPGQIIPAAKLAHSTEALMIAIFIVIWHFYHVHFERLNLSIFTGTINEDELRSYHPLEYQRMLGKTSRQRKHGDKQE